MAERYPGYDVLTKWDSPSFDEVTRGVIRRRLQAVPKRRFFTPGEFLCVEALAARLTGQDQDNPLVPIAPVIDCDLFEARGGGFRHADFPTAPEVWRITLAGIEAEARRVGAKDFADLTPDRQDAILRALQSGTVRAASFKGLSPPRAFNAVLSAVIGVFYAHPAAWSEIGFGGPASPRGYVRMGLDERDPWEAPPSQGSRRS